MEGAKIISLLTYVVPQKHIGSVSVDFDEFGVPIIQMDLHGYTKNECAKVLKNILLLLKFEFTLDLIHGYNHGTVLLEYIHNELKDPRIVNMYSHPYNPGETFIEIAA